MGVDKVVGLAYVSIRLEGPSLTGSSCGSSVMGVRRGDGDSEGGWVVFLGLTSIRKASLSFSSLSLLRA